MTLLLFSFTPISKPLYMTSLSCSCVCSLSPSLNIRLFKVPRILKFHDEFGIDVISPLCVCVCVQVWQVLLYWLDLFNTEKYVLISGKSSLQNYQILDLLGYCCVLIHIHYRFLFCFILLLELSVSLKYLFPPLFAFDLSSMLEALF